MRSGPKQQKGDEWKVKSLTRGTLQLVERSYWRILFEWVGDEVGGFAEEADSG